MCLVVVVVFFSTRHINTTNRCSNWVVFELVEEKNGDGLADETDDSVPVHKWVASGAISRTFTVDRMHTFPRK